MNREHLAIIRGHLREKWRRIGLFSLGTIIGLLVIVQVALPWNNLPLYTTIDGVSVGGQSKSAAISLLNKKYQQLTIGLYFGNNTKAYRQPHPGDIGLTINSQPEVDAKSYPFWLRLVPTSLWWAHSASSSVAPTYKHDTAKSQAYVKKELGQSCDVKPQNASLAYKDNKFQVVPAIDGGTCKLADVEASLTSATPRLAVSMLRIPMIKNPAKIHDAAARNFANQLTEKTKNISIKAGNDTVAIPQNTFLTWLDFTAPDSGLVAVVNQGRSADFFTKKLSPKVSIAAGTSHVTTLDFTEISRVDGASGQSLDGLATAQLMNQWLAGSADELVAEVKTTLPTPVYSRTYTETDTGLTALITHFAQAHPGTFGVGYAELSDDHRHAGYQDTKIFQTASMYKLFVAYSTLKRIESGKFHWSDQIQGGRDLTECFDDMIVKSDNACAEALLDKIGFAAITNEIHAIGLSHSSFLNDYIETTPGDLITYLGMLQQGQLLSPSSTNTLISAMKRNVYRQGIPAGASGQVADKVGFLDALLHDASIVYSPGGTYVLVIMTDNSSWGTIADLTRQIEAWRAQT